MSRLSKALPPALISGAIGSLTSTAALAALARLEGKGALQPTNSTSHWRHGEQAALVRDADLTHTATGYATHLAATIFWAVLFEAWIAPRRPLRPVPMLRDALVVSALAVVVDYGATPRRFTPGWEFVLSKKAMAAATPPWPPASPPAPSPLSRLAARSQGKGQDKAKGFASGHHQSLGFGNMTWAWGKWPGDSERRSRQYAAQA